MNENSNKQGIGILTIVQIVFIILKLTNLINWSWWVVLIPTYINIGLIILGVIIIVATASILKSATHIKKHKDWWE